MPQWNTVDAVPQTHASFMNGTGYGAAGQLWDSKEAVPIQGIFMLKLKQHQGSLEVG
ncbi:hypothetical protein [Siccirubricoccus deserti]|uniref:Uncharacterized protein n=1 Tax=Siccirubricoccus deserti TaxID=2013562 RepID=A0A9X0QY30_9PROT|nr:hypothetical protein [Siccirubricoccus deserti]MBC4016109.1 hypothetical protein [Siccirubricoccus deserti]